MLQLMLWCRWNAFELHNSSINTKLQLMLWCRWNAFELHNSSINTVEPHFNEHPRDQGLLFAGVGSVRSPGLSSWGRGGSLQGLIYRDARGAMPPLPGDNPRPLWSGGDLTDCSVCTRVVGKTRNSAQFGGAWNEDVRRYPGCLCEQFFPPHSRGRLYGISAVIMWSNVKPGAIFRFRW